MSLTLEKSELLLLRLLLLLLEILSWMRKRKNIFIHKIFTKIILINLRLSTKIWEFLKIFCYELSEVSLLIR